MLQTAKVSRNFLKSLVCYVAMASIEQLLSQLGLSAELLDDDTELEVEDVRLLADACADDLTTCELVAKHLGRKLLCQAVAGEESAAAELALRLFEQGCGWEDSGGWADSNGRTPLYHLACCQPHLRLQLARKLLASGCPIDAVAKDGTFALLAAMCSLDVQLVCLLLDSGASLEPPGATPVSWINVACLLCFRNEEVDLDWPFLVRRMVAAGCNPNVPAHGEPPLCFAAALVRKSGARVPGLLDILEELLALGADVATAGFISPSALHALLGEPPPGISLDVAGFRRAVRSLASAGSNMNEYEAGDGSSPLGRLLRRAVQPPADGDALSDWAGLVGVLLEAGASPSQPLFPNTREVTPLYYLVSSSLRTPATEELPAHVLDIARMLVAAERRRAGTLALAIGHQLLVFWLAALNWHAFEPSDLPFLQPTPRQLQMAQVLADVCDPDPWKADESCSPSKALALALYFGSIDLLKVVLDAVPATTRELVSLRHGSGDISVPPIGFARAMATDKLRKALERNPQGGLQETHALPVLMFWRQVRVMRAAGVRGGWLESQRGLDDCPPWAEELARYMQAESAGVWSLDQHQHYPSAFKQATRVLLLINACRGFGVAPRGEAFRAARQRMGIAAGSNPGGGSSGGTAAARRIGVQLPNEVVQHILSLAAVPAMGWLPKLRPFLSEEERGLIAAFL